MFGYDPEVPAGFQDADIEMAELRDAANEVEADCRAGDHRPFEDNYGRVHCGHCSKVLVK